MHLAAALVLACVCAANAKDHLSKWLAEMSPPKSPWASDWMAESNSDISYIFQEPKHRILPIIFPNSNPLMNAWERQEAYDRELPTAPREHELLLPSQAVLGLGGWVAPPYNRSLADFERATDIISSHFTPDVYRDSQNYRYIVIVAVVEKFAEEVYVNGMKSYLDNYTTLVRRFLDQVVSRIRDSVKWMTCLMITSEENILQVKTIINSPMIRSVCRSQPSACDAAIYTATHSRHDKALEDQADLLLDLGTAARLFLHSYARVFEAMAAQNAYWYLMNSRDELADLVMVTAQVRLMLEKRGIPCRQRKP